MDDLFPVLHPSAYSPCSGGNSLIAKLGKEINRIEDHMDVVKQARQAFEISNRVLDGCSAKILKPGVDLSKAVTLQESFHCETDHPCVVKKILDQVYEENVGKSGTPPLPKNIFYALIYHESGSQQWKPWIPEWLKKLMHPAKSKKGQPAPSSLDIAVKRNIAQLERKKDATGSENVGGVGLAQVNPQFVQDKRIYSDPLFNARKGAEIYLTCRTQVKQAYPQLNPAQLEIMSYACYNTGFGKVQSALSSPHGKFSDNLKAHVAKFAHEIYAHDYDSTFAGCR